MAADLIPLVDEEAAWLVEVDARQILDESLGQPHDDPAGDDEYGREPEW